MITEIWRAANGSFDMGFTPEVIIEVIRPYRQQALVTEVIGEGYDFKNTFAGAQLVKLHGFDVTGMRLSESTNKDIQFKARAVFRKAMMMQEPVFVDAETPRKLLVRPYEMEMIVLPLVNIQGAVTHIITALPQWPSIPGAAELDRLCEANPTISVVRA